MFKLKKLVYLRNIDFSSTKREKMNIREYRDINLIVWKSRDFVIILYYN